MKIKTDVHNTAIFVESDTEFDPLEDFEPGEEDETDEFYGEFEAREDISTTTILEDNRPAEERIAELFGRMKLRRKVLLSILECCAEPQAVATVNDLVATLQENDRSVFSAASFCAALEKAGALIKLNEDGTVLDEETPTEPKVVEIDGVQYLEAQPTIEVYWKTTSEGLKAVESNKPLERLMQLFEKDASYAPIYERILQLCSTEEGVTADELGEAVDKDPLVQEPRLFAPHFFEKLEQCEALVWQKTWRITNIGKQGFEYLQAGNVLDAHERAALVTGGE